MTNFEVLKKLYEYFVLQLHVSETVECQAEMATIFHIL